MKVNNIWELFNSVNESTYGIHFGQFDCASPDNSFTNIDKSEVLNIIIDLIEKG